MDRLFGTLIVAAAVWALMAGAARDARIQARRDIARRAER